MTVGTILIYGGLAMLGYTTVKVGFSFARAYRAAKRDLKWARVKIEYVSGAVVYKTIPYLDQIMLSQLLTIVATKLNYREEKGDSGLKTIIPDQVKAVTVEHENWPRPVAGTEEN
jgi:hypothetical protein